MEQMHCDWQPHKHGLVIKIRPKSFPKHETVLKETYTMSHIFLFKSFLRKTGGLSCVIRKKKLSREEIWGLAFDGEVEIGRRSRQSDQARKKRQWHDEVTGL